MQINSVNSFFKEHPLSIPSVSTQMATKSAILIILVGSAILIHTDDMNMNVLNIYLRTSDHCIMISS